MDALRDGVIRLRALLSARILEALLVATGVAGMVVVIGSGAAVRAVEPATLFSGVVDEDRVLGPRWMSAPFTPDSSGSVTFTLSWVGDGDLAIDLREVATDAWVASNTTSESPKSMVADVEAGATYRVGVWARSGSATFDVTIAGTPPPDPVVLLAGHVDSSRATAPKWRSTVFTAASTGEIELGLSWVGTGTLAMDLRRVDGNVWLASNTTTDNPKTLTASVEEGVAYQTAAWAISGTGTFELVLVDDGAPPPTTTTTVPPMTGAPNIVVINVDDARPEALEVLAKVVQWFGDEGTTYENAYVSTPSCCPSRASLMTGQYVHNNGQRDQDTPSTDEDHTIQRYLSEAGYFTAHSGKYLHYYPTSSRAPYWDRWTYFKGSYYDVWVNRDGVVSQSEVYSTVMTFDSAISYVEQFESIDDDRPFYLQVTPVAPHKPWEPEQQYANAPIPAWSPSPSVGEADRSDKPPWVSWLDYTQSEAAVDRIEQFRTMLSVDDQVDRFMTRLDELGEADNTIAVFTSDNGLFWAEHGRSGKFLPYDEAVHVPFLVRWPGHVPAGVLSDDFVSHVDILPTVMAAAGVSVDHTVDGRDILDPGFDRTDILTEYWEDPANNNGVPDWTSIRNEHRMYSEYYDGSGGLLAREFYDLDDDPWELHNLLGDGDPSNDPDVTEVAMQLEEYRTCAGTQCP